MVWNYLIQDGILQTGNPYMLDEILPGHRENNFQRGISIANLMATMLKTLRDLNKLVGRFWGTWFQASSYPSKSQ